MAEGDIKVLIIEDEDLQIEAYVDAIESFNKKSTNNIAWEICKDYENGKTALETPFYDAAIIDLKLSNTEELEGKKLVEEVYGNLRIPIIIYSGSIAQIDDIKETALLRKKLRTDSFLEVLEDIESLYKTGITKLLSPRGEIDKKLTKIFWEHLVDDLDIWIDHNNPKTLMRYVFSHFQEHMEINSDGDFEEYHPAEIYIAPPIKSNIHTGDLIKIGDTHFVVLTPACDIVLNKKPDGNGGFESKRKAEKLVVGIAEKFEPMKMCLNINGDVTKSKVKEFVTNSSFRYHYLPSFKGNDGFVIDFQKLSSISFEDEMERVATISAPFVKDVISRFSLYFARQGQPTFSQKEICEDIFKRSSAELKKIKEEEAKND
jgi:ActR/RegA family two-component response regulator